MSGEKGTYLTEVRMSTENVEGIVELTKNHDFITIRVTNDSENCQWVLKLLCECFNNIISKYFPTDYLLITEGKVERWLFYSGEMAVVIITK